MGLQDRDYYREHRKQRQDSTRPAHRVEEKFSFGRVILQTAIYCMAVFGVLALLRHVVNLLR